MHIQTKRLIIRELELGDLEALCAVLAEPGVDRHCSCSFENRVLRRIKLNMERYRVFGFGCWAVCLKETGELIGDCGLTMQKHRRHYKTGYRVSHTKGYAAKGLCKRGDIRSH